MPNDGKVSAIFEQAKELSVDQLSQLVELLLQRLTDDPTYLPDWHADEIKAGLAEIEANPDGSMSAQESIDWVREQLQRRQAERA